MGKGLQWAIALLLIALFVMSAFFFLPQITDYIDENQEKGDNEKEGIDLKKEITIQKLDVSGAPYDDPENYKYIFA